MQVEAETPEAPAVEVTVIEAPEPDAPADAATIALALATGAALEQAQGAEETADEAVERVELVEGSLEWLSQEVFNLREEVTAGFLRIAGPSSPTSSEASPSTVSTLEEASELAAQTISEAETVAEIALEIALEEPTTSTPQFTSTDPSETPMEAIAESELSEVPTAPSEEEPPNQKRRVLKV